MHGDGVRDVALLVDDAESAWRETTHRGAVSAREPDTLKDGHGEVRVASIALYGDTIHTFVQRSTYNGPFLPGYVGIEGEDLVSRPVGLRYIDHMVGNVGWGEMNRWVKFYQHVMGFRMFRHFDDADISTEYSALMSKVMSNGNERVKFPINEPAQGKRKSQMEEYLKSYRGPGIQHMAMATDDIVETVRNSARKGSNFCGYPARIMTTLLLASAQSTNRWRIWQSWAFWWTAMMRATCYRSSRGRWKTAPRCFSKLFNARGAALSARGISKRCSRQLSGSRSAAAIFDAV